MAGARPHSQQRYQRWLPYEVDRLRSLKAKGRDWVEIAHRLQRSVKSCQDKWSEVGPPPPEPEPDLAGDEAYVEACWTAGGFPYRALLRGQVYTIWPSRRAAA